MWQDGHHGKRHLGGVVCMLLLMRMQEAGLSAGCAPVP